jgi:hypothetical protein
VGYKTSGGLGGKGKLRPRRLGHERGKGKEKKDEGGEWRPAFLGDQIGAAVGHVGWTRGVPTRFGSRDGLQMRSKLLCRSAKLNGLNGQIIQREKFSATTEGCTQTLSPTHFPGQNMIGMTMDTKIERTPNSWTQTPSLSNFPYPNFSFPCVS